MEAAVAAAKASAKAEAAGANAAIGAAGKAGAEAGAEAGGEATKFMVTPEAKEGIPIKPAPGQSDGPVMIRPQDDYMSAVKTTTDYIGGHSYQSDIMALLAEVDQSENKVKGLKLRIVEKENFIDSLIKREDMLQDDLRKDKIATENLHSHIAALKARVERIKKEKELGQLTAQYHEYSSAADKMTGQAMELQDVKDALYSKMKTLHGDITPLREKEDRDMRLSINAGQDETEKNKDAAASAEDARMSALMAKAALLASKGASGPAGGEAGGEAGAAPAAR